MHTINSNSKGNAMFLAVELNLSYHGDRRLLGIRQQHKCSIKNIPKSYLRVEKKRNKGRINIYSIVVHRERNEGKKYDVYIVLRVKTNTSMVMPLKLTSMRKNVQRRDTVNPKCLLAPLASKNI